MAVVSLASPSPHGSSGSGNGEQAGGSSAGGRRGGLSGMLEGARGNVARGSKARGAGRYCTHGAVNRANRSSPSLVTPGQTAGSALVNCGSSDRKGNSSGF